MSSEETATEDDSDDTAVDRFDGLSDRMAEAQSGGGSADSSTTPFAGDPGNKSEEATAEAEDTPSTDDSVSAGATSQTSTEPDEVNQFDDLGLYAGCVAPTYRYERSGAHDKRKQKHLHFRPEVRHAFNTVHSHLEQLDSNVNQADTGELLVMLALRHLDELPEVAKDIGFGISMEDAISRRE